MKDEKTIVKEPKDEIKEEFNGREANVEMKSHDFPKDEKEEVEPVLWWHSLPELTRGEP